MLKVSIDETVESESNNRTDEDYDQYFFIGSSAPSAYAPSFTRGPSQVQPSANTTSLVLPDKKTGQEQDDEIFIQSWMEFTEA